EIWKSDDSGVSWTHMGDDAKFPGELHHATPIQTPVIGTAWHGENHNGNQVAQLYGGYVLPGSRFDIRGGVGLLVSQWNTAVGWPYRAMQFKAALRDTTKTVHPPEDPVNL
ncbi:MAG: hypothetical protein ABWY39_12295, partial [Mycobacterium sp.]